MSRQRDAAERTARRDSDRRRRVGHGDTRRRTTFRTDLTRPRPPYLARGPRVPRRRHPQQGHRGQPVRLPHPDRRRPDPATQLHSGPYRLRQRGALCRRVARNHHRSTDPESPQRRNNVAIRPEPGRPQQQQRPAHPDRRSTLPDAGSQPNAPQLQHGALAQRRPARERIRRDLRRMGIRGHRAGTSPRKQRHPPASHEVQRHRLPPPPRQGVAGRLPGQRTTLHEEHPRTPHLEPRGNRPPPLARRAGGNIRGIYSSLNKTLNIGLILLYAPSHLQKSLHGNPIIRLMFKRRII